MAFRHVFPRCPMSVMTSEITGNGNLRICSTACSSADSPLTGPVMRKVSPCLDATMHKNIKWNHRCWVCHILHIDWCVRPFARISCWLYFYNKHLRSWKFPATKIPFFSQTPNRYYWMRASPTRYLLFHDVIHSVLMGRVCQQIQYVLWSAYVRKTGYKVRPMYWLNFDLA